MRFIDLARFPELVEPGVQQSLDKPWLRMRPLATAPAER